MYLDCLLLICLLWNENAIVNSLNFTMEAKGISMYVYVFVAHVTKQEGSTAVNMLDVDVLKTYRKYLDKLFSAHCPM